MRATGFFIIFSTFVAISCNDSDFSSRNHSGQKGQSGRESAEGADDGSSSGDEDHDGGDGSSANGNPGNDGSNGSGVRVDPDTDNGAPVQATTLKLGINFEDRGLLGDRDYNDDVLCFEGKFEVTKATGVIKSLAEQQVLGSINRNANCRQRITLTIRNPDGTQTQVVREPLQDTLMTEMLNFKTGSTLEVLFQALDDKCDLQTHRVTEPNFVEFGFDVCKL